MRYKYHNCGEWPDESWKTKQYKNKQELMKSCPRCRELMALGKESELMNKIINKKNVKKQ